MTDLQREIASMFFDQMQDAIENEVYGTLLVIARELAGIFENHAANNGETFNKAAFLSAADAD